MQRFEIGVGGDEFRLVAYTLKRLTVTSSPTPGHDDLSTRLGGAMDHQPVAVEDAQVIVDSPLTCNGIGARIEKVGIHRVAAEHVLDREDGCRRPLGR